jgi:hypothetical protein
MTTKCANPTCDHPFRYFRSGKIYLIDMASSSGVRSSNGAREVEYFWLCGDCSENMRVTLDGCGAVKVEQVAAPIPVATPIPDLAARLPIRAIPQKTGTAKAATRGA